MEARTLGEFVMQEGILESLREAVPQIIDQATREAKSVGKHQLRVVSCFKCTAPKACCSSVVVARLYEGIVVAAHLREAGRDTPALRDQLRTTAAAMEAATPYDWRTPCVFLDGNERCTVYASRPTPCGTLLVYTPPAACSDRDAVIDAYVAQSEQVAATTLEEMFRARLALRKKVGRRYLGVLPRMVLLALEAWDRTDFRELWRAYDWPTDAQIARWSPAR